MNSFELEIKNQIMATDIYVCAYSDKYSNAQIKNDILSIISMFKEFEKKYSRFIRNNELDKLNNSSEMEVSTELIDMLLIAKKYHKLTNGYYNPAILGNLLNEGYRVSKNKGYIDNQQSISGKYNNDFDLVKIAQKTQRVNKPIKLKIDLGGIGKGYVVDKARKILSEKYHNFCIDAGGDMYLSGKDVSNDYEYWAIEIENPTEINLETPTMIVTNKAVCTSGINKRKWIKDSFTKNHLINPKTGKSVDNNLATVTVISEEAVQADILAKSLLIMGIEKGLEFCNNENIAGIFFTKEGVIYNSETSEQYDWEKINEI